MKQLGFNIIGHDDCAIAPLLIGDARITANVAERLLNEGI